MKEIKKLSDVYKIILLGFVAFLSLVFASCKEDSGAYNDPNPATATAPVLATVEPESGLPNDTVTITGTGFNTNPAYNFVWFAKDAGTVVSATQTELKVILPALINDSVSVKATVKGSVYWSNTLGFKFNDTTTVDPGGD